MENNENKTVEAIRTLSERVQLDEKLRTARELGCLTAAKHAEEALAWIAEHIFDNPAGITMGFCLGNLNIGVVGKDPSELILVSPGEVRNFIRPAKNAYWESYYENIRLFLGLRKPVPDLFSGQHAQLSFEDFE